MVSAFKKQLAKDLDVFINADEFADWHTLNGVKLKAVIDTSTLTKSFADNQGLFVSAIQIYLIQGDLTKLPSIDSDFTLDGLRYTCKSLQIEQGCDVITAVKVESR